MSYIIEKIIEEAAPHLGPDDVMTINQASDLTGLSYSSINNRLLKRQLTAILDYEDRVSGLQPRRLLLKSEVLALKAELDRKTRPDT
jgi:hypothetical protein